MTSANIDDRESRADVTIGWASLVRACLSVQDMFEEGACELSEKELDFIVEHIETCDVCRQLFDPVCQREPTSGGRPPDRFEKWRDNLHDCVLPDKSARGPSDSGRPPVLRPRENLLAHLLGEILERLEHAVQTNRITERREQHHREAPMEQQGHTIKIKRATPLLATGSPQPDRPASSCQPLRGRLDGDMAAPCVSVSVNADLSSLPESDGRLHRARRPIRKLVALGLSENDLLGVFRRYKHHHHATDIEDTKTDGPRDRSLLLQAQRAIRSLIALGFTECDIADLADLHPAIITRVLDSSEAQIVGHDTAQKLQKAVWQAGTERLNRLLPRLPVHVLEKCHDERRTVDTASGQDLEASVRDVLHCLLLGSSKPDALMPGVTCVLAQLGDAHDGVTLLVAPSPRPDTPEHRLARLEALEQEAEHLLQRYREEHQRLEMEERKSVRVTIVA
jgi:hypothetical protein